jgi:hypothetical protein
MPLYCTKPAFLAAGDKPTVWSETLVYQNSRPCKAYLVLVITPASAFQLTFYECDRIHVLSQLVQRNSGPEFGCTTSLVVSRIGDRNKDENKTENKNKEGLSSLAMNDNNIHVHPESKGGFNLYR